MFIDFNDPYLEGKLLRAQEIARYVQNGDFDAGITGWDWILESGAKVQRVAKLTYAKADFKPTRLVIAVSEASSIQSIADLNGARIATEFVNITNEFLTKAGVQAEVEFSWGATEAKVPELADAIVELVATGTTLRANGLRVIATLLESTPWLIANKAVWQDSDMRCRLQELGADLRGAISEYKSCYQSDRIEVKT